MTDPRIETIKKALIQTTVKAGTSVRISRIKISNYRFFFGDFDLDFNSSNVLIYGENGSGKSSIYRALEFLSKTKFDSIATDRNIFAEGDDPFIEFGFSNGRELIIDSDLIELPSGMDFLSGLSIFFPFLDYKKLLRVHFSTTGNGDAINVYAMLRELFKDYPIENGRKLSDLTDFTQYFDQLKAIINGDLLTEINTLICYFDSDFKITSFVFKVITNTTGQPEPIVHISIDFKDNSIDRYHSFLNEARLSALAISVYFATIRKLLGTLSTDCLKVLVLDDLLISLDMSNRLKLLDILKSKFNDFQIFFFTHDKELFEIYKNKLNWQKYELYLDDTSQIHRPIIKKGASEIELAKEFYAHKEYDCCALLLRKEFEKVLKAYLSPKEQRDRNCFELDLSGLVGKSIAKSNGEAKVILEKLNTDRKHILNPLCHSNDRNVYSQELKTAMDDLTKLRDLLQTGDNASELKQHQT